MAWRLLLSFFFLIRHTQKPAGRILFNVIRKFQLLIGLHVLLVQCGKFLFPIPYSLSKYSAISESDDILIILRLRPSNQFPVLRLLSFSKTDLLSCHFGITVLIPVLLVIPRFPGRRTGLRGAFRHKRPLKAKEKGAYHSSLFHALFSAQCGITTDRILSPDSTPSTASAMPAISTPGCACFSSTTLSFGS